MLKNNTWAIIEPLYTRRFSVQITVVKDLAGNISWYYHRMPLWEISELNWCDPADWRL